MIRGAIFDLDGVILDSMSIWQDLGARYLKKCGVEAEEGLNEILFSMSMEQGYAYLKAHYQLKQEEEEIGRGIQEMLRDFYFYEVPAKEGAEELLRFLSSEGIPCIAATSSPREHVTKALTRLGLLPYFTGILTTGELGTSKHRPDIYLLAAEKLGSVKEETLVLEDSDYALKTAAEAGFPTVGVYDAFGASDPEVMKRFSKQYVHSLRELTEKGLEDENSIIYRGK